MNEVMKAITERYSCRDFSPEPLTSEQVETLVTAALAAPSAMNLMPWHIVVVTDKALIEEMDAEIMEVIKGWEDKSTYNRFKERGGKLFYDAPCMVFITNDGSGSSALDGGIVTQNIALAAHSLELGSVICGMAGVAFSGTKGAEFTKRLKFPEGHTFGMSVCVGKVKSGKAPHEHDTSKITYIK